MPNTLHLPDLALDAATRALTEASDPVPPDPTDHSDLVRVSAYKATVRSSVIGGDLTITVTQSENVENPRGDNECLGIVAVTTGAGHLCVKSAGDVALDSDALSNYEAHNVRWGRTSLPLFLYRHSGERLSTRSWIGRAPHAEWDSALCGFIYTTAERVQNVLGSGLTFKRDADKIAKALADEVQQLDDWLSGNVYDFAITDSKGDYVGGCAECWGDPGEPDDKALSYLWGEALSEARSLIAERNKPTTETIPMTFDIEPGFFQARVDNLVAKSLITAL